MTGDSQPIFERGDVVYGDDPFKTDEAARPWLVVSNHEGRPFHGEQYLALTLPTRSWMDGLVEIPEQAWIRGGTPVTSRPVGRSATHAGRHHRWQGRLRDDIVDQAVDALVAELRR